jgi:hypothetical protein
MCPSRATRRSPHSRLRNDSASGPTIRTAGPHALDAVMIHTLLSQGATATAKLSGSERALTRSDTDKSVGTCGFVVCSKGFEPPTS